MIKTLPRRRICFAPGTLSLLLKYIIGRKEDSSKSGEKLEELVAGIGLPNPVAVQSGRIGLKLLLETSGMNPGSEILVPAYTFGMVYPAITASGFNPVPVDINPNTFQMDPGKAEQEITDRTRAILATHIFGEPCDIHSLANVAKNHKLLLIEDCAQAFGSLLGGRKVGTFGDAGFTSLDKSKPLQAIQGGIVFGEDREWLTRLRERVNHTNSIVKAPRKKILMAIIEDIVVGSPLWRIIMLLFSYDKTQKLLISFYRKGENRKSTLDISSQPGSLALPEILAEIAILNLKTLEHRLSRRRNIRDIYKQILGDILFFQDMEPDSQGSVHMIVARTKENISKLRLVLAIRGIDIAAGSEIADDCLSRSGSHTEKVLGETIALPVSDRMRERDVYKAANIVRAALIKMT